MKKIKLTELKNGDIFTYGGLNWIKLDVEGGTVKAISKSAIEKRVFDEDNHNNWRHSSLRKYLNDEFLTNLLDNGANELDFVEFESDLTADDGLKDYGTSIDKIALISCDDYRKYRNIIPLTDNWWWTITPYSTLASSSYFIRSVYADGTLYNGSACDGNNYMRPICSLKSDILVFVEI